MAAHRHSYGGALTDASGQLDATVCRRARRARDARFDGEFFVAVTSTGIFCRPVCPARMPAEHNVRYFQHAAQANAAGFRPCLRCRPETAPQCPAWLGSTTTVKRALQLIREGALDGEGSVEALATRLGVGARYLNKLFQRELGVAPSQVAKTQRLLLARQLISETRLPLTQVAFSAGFGSVRRFNSALREAFGSAPGALRRRQKFASGGISLELRYRPPYDWAGVLAFFDRHAVSGVESVDLEQQAYTRRFALSDVPGSGADNTSGEFTLRPQRGRDALRLDLSLPAGSPLLPVVNRVRRMADLDANPAAIGEVLGGDPLLKPLLRKSPGVRCPGYWSAGEAALRAIVGQQISTAGARSICARLAAACDGAGFPAPASLLTLGDEHFPMPGKRRETLRALGRLCGSEGVAEVGEEPLTPESLAALPGVGPWTSAMVELRGWGNPDAFPASDLGLVQAWEALGQDRKRLAERAQRWRPFSGYAANLLWRTLS